MKWGSFGAVGWWIAAGGLFAAGIAVRAIGGRGMLFALMVLWGLAVCAGVIAISCQVGEGIGRRIRLSLCAMVALGVLAFAGLEAVVLTGSRTTVSGEPDAMVILGANLWGEEPSPMLKSRLNAALDYLEDHPDMTVVVTGGMADDEVMSEAACMADYLTDRGVDENQILLEEQAGNTLQNLSFSIDLLHEAGYGAGHLLVVSNGAHLARVRMLAQRCGVQADCIAAETPGAVTYQIYFTCREGAALVKSWLFDREVPHA